MSDFEPGTYTSAPNPQEIAMCPCGATPTDLSISDQGGKWSTVCGNCCGEWLIEFRTQYPELDPTDRIASVRKLAVNAWNAAPRRRSTPGPDQAMAGAAVGDGDALVNELTHWQDRVFGC